MTARERELNQAIELARQELQQLPTGKVNHKNGNIWRYQGPESIKFLRWPDDKLLQKLIWRSYLERLLRAAEKEQNAIDRYRKNLPPVKMERIYDTLSDWRKEIISPLVPTPEQYVEGWLNQPYPSHNPIPLTDKFPTGVASCPYVRSKSEILEVRTMSKRKVAFLYEFPLDLRDNTGNLRTIYPDFTILNKKTHEVFYWEHFGKMDDPDYLANFKMRQELYTLNGIVGPKLFQTFEYAGRPLTMNEVEAVVREIKRIGH